MRIPQGIANHYEKVICACCFLILFTNIGLPSTSFSVYQPYLVAISGVGHTGGSIIISIRTFVSLLAMLFVAGFYRVLDCRKGVFIASLCVSAGFALYALFADSFVGLCVASIFTGLGYGLGGMVASTMLISRWFSAHMATAAGIAAVGSGVAAMVLPSLVVGIIDSTSLSAAFGFEAILALVVGVVVFVVLRNRPEDIGRGVCVNQTSEQSKEKTSTQSQKDTQKATSKQVRVNRGLPHAYLPIVFIAMIFVGCISVGGGNYLAVLFTSEGFSTEHAAFLVAVSGACLTFSKLFSGIVFDKIGTRRGSALFFVVFIAGTALLCLSDWGNPSLSLIGVILYGLGLSLGTVGISIWSIELSPKGNQMKTIKNFQVAYALGGFIFTFLPGFMAEIFGTYLVPYVTLLVMVFVAAVIIVTIYTVLDKKNQL